MANCSGKEGQLELESLQDYTGWFKDLVQYLRTFLGRSFEEKATYVFFRNRRRFLMTILRFVWHRDWPGALHWESVKCRQLKRSY